MIATEETSGELFPASREDFEDRSGDQMRLIDISASAMPSNDSGEKTLQRAKISPLEVPEFTLFITRCHVLCGPPFIKNTTSPRRRFQ
jgi:hypothetical protein